MVYLFAANDRRFDRDGQVLPDSLTFDFKVRRQVALFSPRGLPNLLTFELPFEPEHPSLSVTDWLALSDVANSVRNNDRAMRPIAAAAARATAARPTAATTRRRSPPTSTQGCAQHGQGRNCQQLLHALLLRYIYSHANPSPDWRRHVSPATYQSAKDHVLRSRYNLGVKNDRCGNRLRQASASSKAQAVWVRLSARCGALTLCLHMEEDVRGTTISAVHRDALECVFERAANHPQRLGGALPGDLHLIEGARRSRRFFTSWNGSPLGSRGGRNESRIPQINIVACHAFYVVQKHYHPRLFGLP
jgi:hypothetical protein